MVSADSLNDIAERYVRLVLEVGLYAPGYVDAYFGPKEWIADTQSRQATLPREQLEQDVSGCLGDMAGIKARQPAGDALARWQFLERQLKSIRTYLARVSGDCLSFEEEAIGLYDAAPPVCTESELTELAKELDDLLPGSEPLVARAEKYHSRFQVPADKVDAVLCSAMEGCRARTKRFMILPDNEWFELEYVGDRPWSAYNWYKGNYRSLIQFNRDLPLTIDRAVGLAAHEGYPGHHVFHSLLESQLAHAKGWVEYTVSPLFSPQALISEGAAEAGVDLVYPVEERIAFERDVLFPLVGLDPDEADRYHHFLCLKGRLEYSRNEAARFYMNRQKSDEEIVNWLQYFGLDSRRRAEQHLRFIKANGSYVINYNLGRDLVQKHLNAIAPATDHKARWRAFEALLTAPVPASCLKQ